MKLVFLAAATLAVGCADLRREYHYFDDMHYSPAGDTAKLDKYTQKQFDMLEPIGTITYNGAPAYPFSNSSDDAARAERELVAPPTTDLVRGQKKYEIYCAPCHGIAGYADGSVAKKFTGVRPLATAAGKPAERAEAFSIAKIYHIATVGQGAMQGYAPQVQTQDRWNIAAYVKNSLQKRK